MQASGHGILGLKHRLTQLTADVLLALPGSHSQPPSRTPQIQPPLKARSMGIPQAWHAEQRRTASIERWNTTGTRAALAALLVDTL